MIRRDYKAGKRFKKHKIRDYRRKAGKFKNPFFATKAERTVQLKKIKKRVIYGGITTIIIAAFYFLLISPYFYIHKVSVEGIETIRSDDFQNLIDDFLNSRRFLILPNSNIFVFNKSGLKSKIGEEYVLDGLIIDRDFPNAINVKIKERTTNAILTMGNSYYYLDSRGIILRRLGEAEVYPGISTGPFTGEVPDFQNTLENTNLPLIYVQSYGNVEIGQHFLDYEKYEKILQSEDLLTLYTPYQVDFYKINDISASWFKLATTDGWEIHIDLEKNIQTQIVKVYTFIQEQGLNPTDYQYFNVRYEDRIYYK